MVRWYTRHEWKTKPGIRTDGYIVLLIQSHSTTIQQVIWVDEDQEDIPKCWRWAKLHNVVDFAARRTLDNIQGYEV